MAKLEHVLNGTEAFIKSNLFPEVKSKTTLWAYEFVTGFVRGRLEQILPPLLESDIAKMLRIVDNEGNINIGALIETAKNTVEKKGKLELSNPLTGGFRLSKESFEVLGICIEEAAKQQPPQGENESG